MNLKLTFTILFTVSLINSKADSQEDFFNAAKKCDVAGVTNALNAGANINGLTEEGNNALCLAVFCPDVVKLLIEKGCPLEGGKYPAVIQAATLYSTEVLKMLLDAGADPNKTGLTDPSATFKALIANEKAKGKDANATLINAWTSAMATLKPTEVYVLPTVIMATNCVPCLEMLLAKGANVQMGVTDGGSLVHTFANFGNSREDRKAACAASKKVLEGFGLKVPDWYVNLPDDRNGTPEDMLKLLLAKGLDINQKNYANGPIKPQTPLEVTLAAGLGTKQDVMMALINNGADVKIVSENYGPLIFQASQTGYVDVVKAMVDKGVDVNTDGQFFAQTEGTLLKGYTPLTIAALKDHYDLVKYLINAGAKTDKGVEGKFFNTKTNCLTKVTDKTAIYYAIENGNMAMVKFMVESGAKWDVRLKIDQIKERGTGFNTLGQKVYVTTCFDADLYTPSSYAKANKMEEMKDYLKSKGL